MPVFHHKLNGAVHGSLRSKYKLDINLELVKAA